MPTDIIMPQMGESIVEGTITKWLKKPTDKVDAEIPAPASGVLQEIKVTEGTTVGVNTVVGTIAVDGEAVAAPAPQKLAAKSEEKKQEEKKSAPIPPPAAPAPAHEEEEEARSSPLVRKIAREHGVSLSQITGTGLGGRITKQDIMQFIENQGSRVGTDAFVRPAERSEAPPTP